MVNTLVSAVRAEPIAASRAKCMGGLFNVSLSALDWYDLARRIPASTLSDILHNTLSLNKLSGKGFLPALNSFLYDALTVTVTH